MSREGGSPRRCRAGPPVRSPRRWLLVGGRLYRWARTGAAAQRLVQPPPNGRLRAATDRESGIPESRPALSRSPARWPRRGRGWHVPAPLRCSCHPAGQLAHEQGGGGPGGARPPGSAPVRSCRASFMARSTSARCASACTTCGSRRSATTATSGGPPISVRSTTTMLCSWSGARMDGDSRVRGAFGATRRVIFAVSRTCRFATRMCRGAEPTTSACAVDEPAAVGAR